MDRQNSNTNPILLFLRLESNKMIQWTIGGSIVGFISYLLFSQLNLPTYTFTGLDLGITVIPIVGGINLGLVIIALVAAFCGPLAGFIVGFCGTLGVDFLFYNQLIALGSLNLAFGLLGFIVGIPRYNIEEGFTDGKKLGKLMLFTLAGYIVMTILYLISLIVIAKQSFQGTLLYNFAPYFSISLISLFIFAPVFVRIADIVIKQGIELKGEYKKK
ncbi:MAG: ECF transporter S component [Candidatus Kariarchaeaceae archaeon]|jgi:hypothetical protein